MCNRRKCCSNAPISKAFVGPYSAASSAKGSWNPRAFATIGTGFLITNGLAAASSTCSGCGCLSIANGSIVMAETIDY